MKEKILRLLLVMTTIIVFICIVYDNRHKSVTQYEKPEVKEVVDEIIDEELIDSLYDKLPKIYYCSNYPMSKIFQTKFVYESDITTEDYNDNYDDCESYYNVYRVYNKTYKKENVIYLEEYILLYDRKSKMYGFSYNNFFTIDDEKINIFDGKVLNEDIIKYGSLYKHSFKLNGVGMYRWYSTSLVKE